MASKGGELDEDLLLVVGVVAESLRINLEVCQEVSNSTASEELSLQSGRGLVEHWSSDMFLYIPVKLAMSLPRNMRCLSLEVTAPLTPIALPRSPHQEQATWQPCYLTYLALWESTRQNHTTLYNRVLVCG